MHDPVVQTALIVHHLTDSALFWVVCVSILIALGAFRRWYEASVFLIALILTTGSVQFIKVTLEVARPTDALVQLSSYSFPSGHAAGSMFLAVMGMWLLFRMHTASRRRIALSALFLITAAIIGASRVLINVHTSLEVLTGYMVGSCIPLFAIWTSRVFRMETKKPDQ